MKTTPVTKLFTKSAFKTALDCPTQLYYYYDSAHYGNQNLDDDFLQSLAEGGFQVGELAKIYYGITPKTNIDTLDYEGSVKQTNALLQQPNVNIAEPAFRFGNCFVRVDILEKKGHVINLIEVKAKSWDPTEDSFTSHDGTKVESSILPYVYDTAFQKWVATQALHELFPHEKLEIHSFLMMADKSQTAPVDGMNQYFTIEHQNKRTRVVCQPGADQLAQEVHILTPFEITDLCDDIIAGKTKEQEEVMGTDFSHFVEKMSDLYCRHERQWTPVSKACFTCPFHAVNATQKDGYKECWKQMAGFQDADFDRPLVQDLWGAFIKRGNFIDRGKYFLEDLGPDDFKMNVADAGLHHTQRKIIQIGLFHPENTPAQKARKKELLAPYASCIENNIYLDKEGLRKEMETWKFPLHMIDFETTAVALPFYKGMRPYEQVAFQFSHHIIDKGNNGEYTIRHAGQFINTQKGYFPNFDFLRELRRQLSTDDGSVFRYANHENSILCAIRTQLEASNEPDKEELITFINSITHDGRSRVGERDMIDLLEVVKRYFYHPIMKGSNSIKVVLPAVLNASSLLQNKYSQPIYGTTAIPSQNDWSSTLSSASSEPGKKRASQGKVWIQKDASGVVLNPYKLLPPVNTFLHVTQEELDRLDDTLDESVANGGAALVAYSKLQFSEGPVSDALVQALLHYCELDTLSMVFIWEYFNDVI